MRKDTPYTFTDLLEDDDFISFVNHPSKEGYAYWNNLIRRGKVDRDDYKLATHYIKKLAEANPIFTEDDIKDMWLNIKIENKKKDRNKHKRFYLFLTHIAIAGIFIIGAFLFLQYQKTENTPVTIAENNIGIENVAKPELTGNDIQIVLSNNDRITVAENHSEIKYNEQGEAEINSQAIEKSTQQENTEKKNTFNQVIIPKGKFSSLILSDGTKLWLNAASRVVYPPVFDQEKREIYIEGEAYIDVVPNKNQPFIVKTKQMEVNVLGTSFNISAYEDEKAQSVVLVSGAVTIKTENDQQVTETQLSPNQLFTLTENETKVQTVNTKNYISWKEGYYIYKSEKLSHILNRLSNYYGIDIEYDDRIAGMRYSGKMDLKEDIERVLRGLSHTAPISYWKENNIHHLSFNDKKELPME